MDSAIFEDVYRSYLSNFSDGRGWTELSKIYGYSNPEAFRSAFKREKNRRNLPNKLEKTFEKKKETKAKILCLDIETSPINCLVWDIWNQDIRLEAILDDWFILSWSAKWLFDSNIKSGVLTSHEVEERNDFRIVESIWNLLDSADIVIGHNADRFDLKRLNTRFIYHKMPPVSHYQSIDTLTVAKNTFDFTSNKLDYINQYLGLPVKESTGFDLWKRCWFGEPKALKELESYNRNDVAILEDLYLKLRPYIRNHPNMNLWNEENISVCPNCGSSDIIWHTKSYYTYTGKYKAFRCSICDATGRSRIMELDREKRKSIVR